MRPVKPKDFVAKKAEVGQEDLRSVYTSGSRGRTAPGANLFLVGLRASGKSTVGRRAAKALGRTFVDTDTLLEAKAGKSIADFVASEGWEAFRALETQVLAGVCETPGQVVATGGGIVLAKENRRLLKGCGKVFYLLAPLPTLLARLQASPGADQRPALTDLSAQDEMRAMFVEREPLYMEVADFILAAEHPLDEVVEDMLEKVRLLMDA